MTTHDFFKQLPSFNEIDRLYLAANYHPAPMDWVLVLTDVVSSTMAIEAGRYKEVNMAGVATIISAKNALQDFEFPYVFGGDGATFLIPQERANEVKQALSYTRKVVRQQFNLELRVGFVPIAKIYAAGFFLNVAKVKLTEGNFIAHFQGSGFVEAEKWVKSDSTLLLSDDFPAQGHHEGLECRWNPIPSSQGEMMALIIQKISIDQPSEDFFKTLLQEMKEIVREFQLVKPEQLNRSWPPRHLMQELKLKNKNSIILGLKYLSLMSLTFVISLLIRGAKSSDQSAASKYLDQFAKNTDFLKFDDTLKMVIDVTSAQKAKLLQLLDRYQSSGLIYYGCHFSTEALVTCFVRSLTNHVHFIDGGSGGYALAAKQLKQARAKA